MLYILILTFAVVIATISYGFAQRVKEDLEGSKKIRKALKINLAAFIPVISAAIIFMIPNVVHAATEGAVTSGNGIAYIAAALATGIGAIAASYAVAVTGSAALGAISENPKIFGKTLIYVGLAEGIAIYGLIISIMILSKI